MNTANLRDILTANRGRVPLDKIRRSTSWTGDEDFRDALEFLLDCDLAQAFTAEGAPTKVAADAVTIQAMRGCGKAVEQPKAVKVLKEGQRPINVLPKMSEGSARRTAAMRAAASTRVENGLEALRNGASLEDAIGVGPSALKNYREVRPDLYQKIQDARREFLTKAAQQLVENRLRDEATALDMVRKGLTKVSQIEHATNWSGNRALLALQRLKQKSLLEWTSPSSGWRLASSSERLASEAA